MSFPAARILRTVVSSSSSVTQQMRTALWGQLSYYHIWMGQNVSVFLQNLYNMTGQEPFVC